MYRKKKEKKTSPHILLQQRSPKKCLCGLYYVTHKQIQPAFIHMTKETNTLIKVKIIMTKPVEEPKDTLAFNKTESSHQPLMKRTND